MPPKPQQQRKPSSAPPDSLPPKTENLSGDLRREDTAGPTAIAPDGLPTSEDDIDGPAAQHTLASDGGSLDHPTHDDDPSEDFMPRDYEEQIEKVSEARRDQSKRAKVEER